MEKNKLIFVPAIILIVFGAIGTISNIIGVFNAGSLLSTLKSLMSYASMDVDVDSILTMLKVAAVIGIIDSLIYLIAGIMGVKYAAVPEKAGVCFKWGLVMVAMCVVNFIFTLISNNKLSALYESIGQTSTSGMGSAIVGLAIGLILPVLYILGAKQNMSANSGGTSDFNA